MDQQAASYKVTSHPALCLLEGLLSLRGSDCKEVSWGRNVSVMGEGRREPRKEWRVWSKLQEIAFLLSAVAERALERKSVFC